jgi:hypothetical protein
MNKKLKKVMRFKSRRDQNEKNESLQVHNPPSFGWAQGQLKFNFFGHFLYEPIKIWVKNEPTHQKTNRQNIAPSKERPIGMLHQKLKNE